MATVSALALCCVATCSKSPHLHEDVSCDFDHILFAALKEHLSDKHVEIAIPSTACDNSATCVAERVVILTNEWTKVAQTRQHKEITPSPMYSKSPTQQRRHCNKACLVRLTASITIDYGLRNDTTYSSHLRRLSSTQISELRHSIKLKSIYHAVPGCVRSPTCAWI